MRLVLAVILLAFSAFAEDDLTKEATEFISAHEDVVAGVKWTKSWIEKAEQLQKDFNLANEEQAADRYLTEWFRSRADAFEKRPGTISKKDKLTMCHFYIRYKTMGWFIPPRIAEQITKRKYDEVFKEGK